MAYVYSIEMPQEYADILKDICVRNNMTHDELLSAGLRYIFMHPGALKIWMDEYDQLDAAERSKLDQIHIVDEYFEEEPDDTADSEKSSGYDSDRQDLIDKLQKGLDDIRNGNVRPFEEFMDELTAKTSK